MDTELILFAIAGVVALGAGVAMISSRSAIYSALFLVLNLGAIAVLYLLLNAPFLAMVQVSVYAGAIMVLFLFVIMLLGAEHNEGEAGDGQPAAWQQPAAIGLAVALLAVTGYTLFGQTLTLPTPAVSALPDSSPKAIGTLLFSHYLLPFEITSVLLLAAVVGAVVLTHSEDHLAAKHKEKS